MNEVACEREPLQNWDKRDARLVELGTPRPGRPCSGVGTAQWMRQVSKTEEISPDTMQPDTEAHW